jgi:release factor glutamine methyltransferase
MIRHLISPPLGTIVRAYLKRERSYSYRGIRVRVSPGVFHPGLFFSTKILLTHALSLELKGKNVLELGAGSGLIALSAASRGAVVTATDLSARAVDDLRTNSKLNNLPITVLHSDLFDKIPDSDFDLIIINPPYYPRDPVSESDLAWHCGRDFGYFRKLFRQLRRFKNCPAKIFMILSEDCAVGTIRSIASADGMDLAVVSHVVNWFEANDVYSIEFMDAGASMPAVPV